MPSTPFGEQLKRERELRGVSLEEVSAATRIAPRFLEALENEQWDKLPGGVFNRGFIRAVARYLGLDEENLVSEYALQTKGRTDPGVVPDPPVKPEPIWGRIAALVGLILLVLAVVAVAFHYIEPRIAARFHKSSGEPPLPTYASATPASSAAENDDRNFEHGFRRAIAGAERSTNFRGRRSRPAASQDVYPRGREIRPDGATSVRIFDRPSLPEPPPTNRS
jgi:cytoskeletal protein RodZ